MKDFHIIKSNKSEFLEFVLKWYYCPKAFQIDSFRLCELKEKSKETCKECWKKILECLEKIELYYECYDAVIRFPKKEGE